MEISERIYLLPKEGNQYKANLHAHTTVSDGKFTPEELKRLYMSRGYSVIAYTDHKLCEPHPELTDDSFVALTGVEIAFGIGRSKSIHICGISRDPLKSIMIPNNVIDDMELVNGGIETLNSENFITTLNHPRWSGMSYDDLVATANVKCMEVANGFEMIQDGYGVSDALYELELRRGRKVYPIATDDSHTESAPGEPGYEYFRGFTMIKAPKLTYDALIFALDAGNFYASCGPTFGDVYIEGSILHVECSAVAGVYAHGTLYSHRAAKIAGGNEITSADLDVTKIIESSEYIFVEIVDAEGKRAWCAPLWLK